jgi:hypothetical protein
MSQFFIEIDHFYTHYTCYLKITKMPLRYWGNKYIMLLFLYLYEEQLKHQTKQYKTKGAVFQNISLIENVTLHKVP